MHLPALLPQELQFYGIASSEEELLGRLTKKPADLLLFFEYACSDETWSEQFSKFMRGILRWLTIQFYYDHLSMDYAKKVARIIQDHFSVLQTFLPRNILIQLKNGIIKINSLLIGSSSEFFRQLLLKECRDLHKQVCSLKEISQESFVVFEEFFLRGNVHNLWGKSREELMNILTQASEWQLESLREMCEEVLKRYIDRSNVVETLIMSHTQQLPILKNACIDFINQLYLGFSFEKTSQDSLAFVFHDFQTKALDFFDKFKFHVTQLVCSGSLTQDSLFGKVINECPKLVSLDISHSSDYSEYFFYIPRQLSELNASKCAWLTEVHFRKLIQYCPRLERLKLSSNLQLNYAVWVELQKLKHLKELDLSRCFQIDDRDLKIILMACREMTKFSLDGCKKITDRGFFDLARAFPKIRTLNLSRCSVTDPSLIEIASRCHQLTWLDLSYCENITGKGLLETMRLGLSLQFIDISHCHLSTEIIDKIQKFNRA